MVDVTQLRMALSVALDRAYQAAAQLQQSEVLILSGGFVFLVREGVVVTVIKEDGRHDHARSMARLRRDAQTAVDGHGD